MNETLQQSVREIVELLAARKYVEVEARTKGVRLNAQEISDAIRSYGRRLVIPPKEGFELMDIVKVRDSTPPRWSVTMPLWTREEGRSDLSLEVTIAGDPRAFVVELDNLHVL